MFGEKDSWRFLRGLAQRNLDIKEESPEKRFEPSFLGSHQACRVLSSFIMETEEVFFMVYFIVLALSDYFWIIFVMSG